MSNTLRFAALGAALLAGTSAANAQAVIVTEPDAPPPVTYVAPPAYVAPAPTVVIPAPGPGVVVEPAPITEEVVTPAPPTIATETIVTPAPRPAIRRPLRTTEVRLTTRQRREVLHTVRDVRPARRVTERVSYRVGAPLPATVPLYAMPERVVYEAPALRGYDYAMIGDRMLVVEPASKTVVEELY